MGLHHFTVFALLALPLDGILLSFGLKGSQSVPMACLAAGTVVWWFRKPLDGLMHPPQLPTDRPKATVRGNRQTRRAQERANKERRR